MLFLLNCTRAEFLTGMLAYLCGSIEYSPDHGKAWRAAITPFLHALGHHVYNPALDEKKDLTDEEVRDFRNWKVQDPQRFQATVRKIIDYDLDWIENRCDYIVAYWDEYAARGAGTQGELTVAYRRGIPVFMVTALPTSQISGWILGCAAEVFANFDELKNFMLLKYATEKQSLSAASD